MNNTKIEQAIVNIGSVITIATVGWALYHLAVFNGWL